MIGNMTSKELSALYYLRKEIEMQSQRLFELETIAESCTSRITGLPAGKGISDKVGKYSAEIADLKKAIDINLKQCFFELNRLTKYIQEAKDPLIRQIMTYRYIHGFNWRKTAFSIGGSNNIGSLKMMLHRYLEKN